MLSFFLLSSYFYPFHLISFVHSSIHPSIDSSCCPLRLKQNMQLQAPQLHLWLEASQELGSYANQLVLTCWSLCLLVVSCPFVHKEMDFDFIATPISIVFGHQLQNIPGDYLSTGGYGVPGRKEGISFVRLQMDGWLTSIAAIIGQATFTSLLRVFSTQATEH